MEIINQEVEKQIKEYINELTSGKIERGCGDLRMLVNFNGKTVLPYSKQVVDFDLYVKTFISKLIEIAVDSNDFEIPDDFIEINGKHLLQIACGETESTILLMLAGSNGTMEKEIEENYSPYYRVEINKVLSNENDNAGAGSSSKKNHNDKHLCSIYNSELRQYKARNQSQLEDDFGREL